MKFAPAKLKKLIEKDTRLGKDIADLAGFSRGSLSHWALGRRVPGADELAALARVFAVPLDYFFEGETEPMELRDLPSPFRRSPPPPDALARLRRQTLILEGALEQLKKTVSEMENPAASPDPPSRLEVPASSEPESLAAKLVKRGPSSPYKSGGGQSS